MIPSDTLRPNESPIGSAKLATEVVATGTLVATTDSVVTPFVVLVRSIYSLITSESFGSNCFFSEVPAGIEFRYTTKNVFRSGALL